MIFILLRSISKIFLKFHNSGEKRYNDFDKGKKPDFFPIMREKRAEIRSRKLNEICGERDSLKDEHMFMRGVIPWYAMLSYGMVWYGV